MAACALCGAAEYLLVAKIHFWDLAEGELHRCDRCRHTQCDPPLNSSVLALGCEALDRQQQASASTRDLRKGFFRAFTKGVGLGFWLKIRNAKIRNVLELGPGDGYVSRGVQVFYPGAKVTALDIVPSTLTFVRETHGYETIHGTPEQLTDISATYDLVLARDILEHTQEPGKVIRLIYERLNLGGYFHFITPNGREDIWPFKLRWELSQKPGELLLNHVHYFDPRGLKDFLEQIGFRTTRYFLYGFKWARRGRGWKRSPRLMAPESNKQSAHRAIEDNPPIPREASELGIRKIGSQGWTRSPFRFVAGGFWYLHHRPFLRLPARFGVGHEIFAVLRK